MTGENYSEIQLKPPTPLSSPKRQKVPQLSARPVQKADRNRIAEAAEENEKKPKNVDQGVRIEAEFCDREGIESGVHEEPDSFKTSQIAAATIQTQLLE